MTATIFLFLSILLIVIATSAHVSSCEKYSPITGFSYADGCEKMPVPENIRASSRSPPFYNLNAVRTPFCSYRNFTFPPPMGYSPITETPPELDGYQYWFKEAVLSHPQTAYLV